MPARKEETKCPACGNGIAPDDRFCRSCGSRITRQSTRAKSKNPLPPQPARKPLLLAGGVLAGLIIIIVLLLTFLPVRGKKQPVHKPTNLGAELTGGRVGNNAEEIEPNTVYGQVVSVQRGTITIQSLNTGTVYTVYVGRRTDYYPRRYPSLGEKVKVFYILDRGCMKATRVQMQP
jgi:hypothetical protein